LSRAELSDRQQVAAGGRDQGGRFRPTRADSATATGGLGRRRSIRRGPAELAAAAGADEGADGPRGLFFSAEYDGVNEGRRKARAARCACVCVCVRVVRAVCLRACVSACGVVRAGQIIRGPRVPTFSSLDCLLFEASYTLRASVEGGKRRVRSGGSRSCAGVCVCVFAKTPLEEAEEEAEALAREKEDA
jgi:hypothetical protein